MPPRTIWDNFRDLVDFRDVRKDMFANLEHESGRLYDAAGKPVAIVRGLLGGKNKARGNGGGDGSGDTYAASSAVVPGASQTRPLDAMDSYGATEASSVSSVLGS